MSKENKSKTIFRVDKVKGYSIVDNTAANDTRLSYGAIGVMYKALTKPDDWKFYIQDFSNTSSDGITKVSRYFKELRLAGYFELVKVRNELGQIIDSEYVVHEKPLHTNPIKGSKPKTKNLIKGFHRNSENPISGNNKNREIQELENVKLLNTDNKLNTDNNKILIEETSFPSQDKVTLFFEHHKKQLMQTRKHGDPDLHLVDKLGTLIEWDIETYDKILKAKQNSAWEVRRNQPNTAKWLLATMENENLETAKSNVVTFPKYDLEELRKEGFV